MERARAPGRKGESKRKVLRDYEEWARAKPFVRKSSSSRDQFGWELKEVLRKIPDE